MSWGWFLFEESFMNVGPELFESVAEGSSPEGPTKISKSQPEAPLLCWIVCVGESTGRQAAKDF